MCHVPKMEKSMTSFFLLQVTELQAMMVTVSKYVQRLSLNEESFNHGIQA
jgi:diadenosine tetraphosphate (Ap4A) HIT family hydrolase